MNIRQRTLTLLATATLLVGACGGDDGGSGDDGDAAPSATTAQAAGTGGGLPDPCKVFSSADLTAAFGGAPGAGNASGGSTRRVCQYAPGTATVGVSTADQYEGSASLAKANGSTCTDTAGVGDKAVFCNAYGQVGQLYWVRGDVMYDVTASSVDVAKFTALAAKAQD